MWLPRFIDKARHHFASTLHADYQRAFCSPLGIDGVFFAHFALKKEDILAVIQREQSDEAVVAWFVARPESNAEKIRAWNDLAPNIGKEGFPGHRTFQWGMKHIYSECSDPRVTSGFAAIAWDEGFLDDVCPKEPNKAPEPTSLRGTPRAYARGAPLRAVAHL